MRVVAEPSIEAELYDHFKMPDPNFTPNGYSKYDGLIRFYHKSNGMIDIGLLYEVFQFAKKHKYTIELDPALKYMNDAPEEEIREFVDGLKLSRKTEDGDYVPAECRDYQFESVMHGVRDTRCVLRAATSAGKSLILYILARYYRMRRQALESTLKTLIVVPSVHLVTQLKANFEEYSQINKFNSDAEVHMVFGDADKFTNKNIVISTWQGIQNMPKEFFHQFGDVVVDEVHTSKADKLSYILNNCIYCDHRVGLTGTLGNNPTDIMRVKSHFGRVHEIISARELIEKGYAADIEVEMVQLVYPIPERGLLTGDYSDEIEFLISHKARNEVILTMAKYLKGNTAIMFARIDAHMMVIYEELIKYKQNVFVINGEVPAKVRAEIQAAMERGDDITLLASYGTMQQGVSINKLHNLVLAHPSKSFVRVLQTLGRLMRLHSTKVGTPSKIWDVVDDLRKPDYWNHSLRHSLERYRFYTEERHPIKRSTIQL
ncbi:DNA helicase [Erwinia phage vB_EamM-Bue1]|uniref:RNA-DNA and DNA-DNA helicase n=2 Tax=Nezavisimistyvirus TaxID=2841279 RepID=A0A0A0YSV9_9CAUD|nr:DNA helicase [Erwinia phage phiEa2809]YP_009837713.1 DNA helicase [Erwinia phage vB_EamM-Bue1]AIX13105.1 RNA-DNA and DNA-DNA helicase [Erwinia phage phiEa2809]AVO22951.1 DNA helicase [Erwinia phage vB_EamM-Bue1]